MTTRKARRYQRGSLCKSENGEIWYGKYYPAPGAPQKRVQLGRCSEINEKQARSALDDIIAVLNRNPGHALGAELVGRFVKQVFVPQKYENGDWRKGSGEEVEGLFRRWILPEIGELRCRDLKAEHLRAVLRKVAGTGLCYQSVNQVRFSMGDMVKMMLAEEYLTSNIAAGLKTPKTAKKSDRSRLRRATLGNTSRRGRLSRKGNDWHSTRDVLRVASVGGLWTEKRRSVRERSDSGSEVGVQRGNQLN